MYHLPDAADRELCLREVHRVLRRGGVAFVAAISRWGPRLHAHLVRRGYRDYPNMSDELPGVEQTGVMPPLVEGGFVGYTHRPDDLRREVESVGFACLDLVAVEGLAFALPDLDERLADETDRAVVLAAARAIERVPELLGLGPHLLATARRP
jgi:SAM-dependent methyltransferase